VSLGWLLIRNSLRQRIRNGLLVLIVYCRSLKKATMESNRHPKFRGVFLPLKEDEAAIPVK